MKYAISLNSELTEMLKLATELHAKASKYCTVNNLPDHETASKMGQIIDASLENIITISELLANDLANQAASITDTYAKEVEASAFEVIIKTN